MTHVSHSSYSSVLRGTSRLRLRTRTGLRMGVPPSVPYSSSSASVPLAAFSTSTTCSSSAASSSKRSLLSGIGFHTTAGTSAPSRSSKSKSKSKSRTKSNSKTARTQPTSSRRLARPEAVAHPRPRSLGKSGETNTHTPRVYPRAVNPFVADSPVGVRRGRSWREEEEEARKERRMGRQRQSFGFDRDNAPHSEPVVIDPLGLRGSPLPPPIPTRTRKERRAMGEGMSDVERDKAKVLRRLSEVVMLKRERMERVRRDEEAGYFSASNLRMEEGALRDRERERERREERRREERIERDRVREARDRPGAASSSKSRIGHEWEDRRKTYSESMNERLLSYVRPKILEREKEKERLNLNLNLNLKEAEEVKGGEFYHPKRLVEQRDGLFVDGNDTGSSPSSPPFSSSSSSSSSSSKSDTSPISTTQEKPQVKKLPTTFTSPPLLSGFVHALEDMFGSSENRAKPTVVQALSLRWIGEWVWGTLGGGGRKEDQANLGETTTTTTTSPPTTDGTTLAPGNEITLTSTTDAVIKQTRAPRTPPGGWRQFLLAAETGSGKSIAYLLPMLQWLKMSERSFVPFSLPPSATSLFERNTKTRTNKIPTYAPRGLVLAPTHELARQLTGFAKELVHNPDVKLRVACPSRTMKNRDGRDSGKERRRRRREVMSGMDAVVFDGEAAGGGVQEGECEREGMMGDERKGGRGADVVVGTPSKLLEMVRGRGWDRLAPWERDEDVRNDETRRTARDPVAQVGFGFEAQKRGDMALEDVEWVVVDEADVLFDPDFEASTRQLLADISAARGVDVPLLPFESLSSLPSPSSPPSSSSSSSLSTNANTTTPIAYPFHLVLASATIPTSLNAYLSNVHPRLLRLASPGLHKLPKKLGVEYVKWSGGSKEKDVWKRVREVWRDDWVEFAGANGAVGGLDFMEGGDGKGKKDAELSQIVIFCNRSTKAEALGAFLGEQISSSSSYEGRGNESVLVITGGKSSVGRAMGSNKHLESFLRVRNSKRRRASSSSSEDMEDSNSSQKTLKPLILITTSLLSRGLDFAPSVKHVFVVDQPRNKVDFLHRAGRAGRAGMSGRVVVFGKGREGVDELRG